MKKTIFLVIIVFAVSLAREEVLGEQVSYNSTSQEIANGDALAKPCYEGVFPSFFTDPETFLSWYYRYEVWPSEVLDCKQASKYKYIYSAHLVNGSFFNTDQTISPEFFSSPYVISESNDERSVRHLESDAFSFLLFDAVEYTSIGYSQQSDPFKGNLEGLQQIHPVLTRSKEVNLMGMPIPFTLSSRSTSIPVRNPASGGSDILMAEYRWDSIPFVTSNGCWLIANSSETIKPEESAGNPRLPGYEWKSYSFNRSLDIYALGSKFKHGSKEAICETPEFVNDTGNSNLWRKTKRGVVKHTQMKLFDFHEENEGSFKNWPLPLRSGKKIEPKLFEGASRFGIDYAAYSPNASRLNMVYQKGFLSSLQKGAGAQDEKLFDGDLVYIYFTNSTGIRSKPGSERMEIRPIIDIRRIDLETGGQSIEGEGEEQKFNITQGCTMFEGWESNPSFSADKSKLYFVARKEKGNDSSATGLYVVDFLKVQDGEFNCSDPNQISNLVSELSESRYPILNYRVSSSSAKLEVWYEEKGETVIRFYKLNKSGDKIVYRYPEVIKGLGKVYDITRAGLNSNGGDGQIYYVFNSRLDFPVSISRCKYNNTRFTCGSWRSPIHTTSYGRKILDANELLKKDSVLLEKFDLSWKGEDGNSIPGFMLKPLGNQPTKGALISIHGGPNEAWDGRFGQIEYEMASRGYTVYLPNPSGSTGYGYEYTEKGNKSWSINIYSDIKRIVSKVKKQHKKEKVYLVGFSFGGYIANWIQTDSDSNTADKLEALVAINPLFDTRKFAASTDQYWFPEYQLGCSGSHCQDLDCEADKTHPLITQNPYCNIDNATNKINKSGNKLPIFVISGTADQRVNFKHNKCSNLYPYHRKEVPYRFEPVPNEGHALGAYTLLTLADKIDNWFKCLGQPDFPTACFSNQELDCAFLDKSVDGLESTYLTDIDEPSYESVFTPQLVPATRSLSPIDVFR